MINSLLIFVSFIVAANALTPDVQYFNLSQQVLDLTWGTDTITEPRLQLQKYLCRVCDQIVEVAKVYVKNNQVKSGGQLVGFLTDQHYFDEYYESCGRKYEQSFAKSGEFLACSTVLEPIVEGLKQALEKQGANIVNEKKQICYEQGLKLCSERKKNFWTILELEKKLPVVGRFVFNKFSDVY